MYINTSYTICTCTCIYNTSYNICTSEFLISFEAWAKLAQQWSVCAPLGIHLEPINKELKIVTIKKQKNLEVYLLQCGLQVLVHFT